MPTEIGCMLFTLTSTCMNILSQFYFLTPMDYYVVHGLKGNFGHFEGKLKGDKLFGTGEAMPKKIALYINSTCIKF